MKCLDIEVVTQRSFTFAPQLEHFELPDLVGECLTRPGNVTIDFIDDIGFSLRRVIHKEIYRLLPRPALVVHAGIDNEAYRTPHVIGQCAEMGVRVFIESQFVAEALAIQAPAFGECGEVDIFAKLRCFLEFHLQRDLQVMPRDGLVYGK